MAAPVSPEPLPFVWRFETDTEGEITADPLGFYCRLIIDRGTPAELRTLTIGPLGSFTEAVQAAREAFLERVRNG